MSIYNLFPILMLVYTLLLSIYELFIYFSGRIILKKGFYANLHQMTFILVSLASFLYVWYIEEGGFWSSSFLFLFLILLISYELNSIKKNKIDIKIYNLGLEMTFNLFIEILNNQGITYNINKNKNIDLPFLNVEIVIDGSRYFTTLKYKQYNIKDKKNEFNFLNERLSEKIYLYNLNDTLFSMGKVIENIVNILVMLLLIYISIKGLNF